MFPEFVRGAGSGIRTHEVVLVHFTALPNRTSTSSPNTELCFVIGHLQHLQEPNVIETESVFGSSTSLWSAVLKVPNVKGLNEGLVELGHIRFLESKTGRAQ